MKEISIIDVAKQAGVSPATVSRALNNTDLVAPKTRKKILQIVQELNFELNERRPSTRPRSPRKKRELISFLVLLDPIHRQIGIPSTLLELKQGIMNVCIQQNFIMDMHIISCSEPLPADLLANQPAGFILVGQKPSLELQNQLVDIPCCWVLENKFRPEWGDQILPDHEAVGHLAAEFFLAKQCKNVLSINLGPENRITQLRDFGFSDTIKNSGVTYRKLYAEKKTPVLPPVNVGTAYIPEITERFLELQQMPDGIFIDSDSDAACLIPHFNNVGIDLSGIVLLSCNNQETHLGILNPRPATIDVHFKTIGELAVTQLADRIHNGLKKSRIRTLISPTLISENTRSTTQSKDS